MHLEKEKKRTSWRNEYSDAGAATIEIDTSSIFTTYSLGYLVLLWIPSHGGKVSTKHHIRRRRHSPQRNRNIPRPRLTPKQPVAPLDIRRRRIKARRLPVNQHIGPVHREDRSLLGRRRRRRVIAEDHVGVVSLDRERKDFWADVD